ncbi:flavoprotein [Ktedonosporobacter rubrisoli]|uniref:Flavoprotein n=1 Tax=Ktedonosporobacter rubrisoli TaxID=2509675 RepID=A0A4V0YYF4_KTERU|nr:flavoprotein [Ktedonosporobacter rubrisoli]QBD76031.1 flavoprotein [Ktedonosporobacter rubrisoli]
MTEEITKRVIYHIVCAAPPAQDVQAFVHLAQAAGWDVCLIATPHAKSFIDGQYLEQLTGHPVRSEFKPIGTTDIFPKMDAMVIAPMTLNTTTKWAQGHADTLALSQLCKGLGLGLPIVAAPCITGPFSRHPAFSPSIALLREYGVKVLYDPERYPAPQIVPWPSILEALNAAASYGPAASF